MPNKPIHEIRSRQVKATIWENKNEKGVYYTFTLSRLYKADSQWRSATTFSTRETLNLLAAVVAVDTWIHSRTQPRAETSSAEEPGANG